MGDTKSNAGIAKHPLAIAWDEWLASVQGQGCVNFGNLTAGYYLENRLHAAFNAGAAAAQSSLAKQVLEEFQTRVPWKQSYVDMIDERLRELFTRLGITIGE